MDQPSSSTPQPRHVNPGAKKPDGWDLLVTACRTLLLCGIGLTTAMLLFFIMPYVFANGHGAPVIPFWPVINKYILWVHAITALPPLLIGVPGFSKIARMWSLKWHRWLGTVYCVCIWISATLGIMLAMANQNGALAILGFGLLGMSWFTTTWYAYKTGVSRDIVSHRRWMYRSYALTLAVVTIRPMFLMEPQFGMSNHQWYVMATWMCWVPNLIIAEFIIRITKPNGKPDLKKPTLPLTGTSTRPV